MLLVGKLLSLDENPLGRDGFFPDYKVYPLTFVSPWNNCYQIINVFTMRKLTEMKKKTLEKKNKKYRGEKKMEIGNVNNLWKR